jgi:hypothetical protein
MSSVSTVAEKLGISEEEVRQTFTEAELADQAIEIAANKEPVLTGATTHTLNIKGRTWSIPLYVNYSQTPGPDGEQLEILNGPVPEGLGLDGYRVVVTPREMFQKGVANANDPDLAVSFQKSRQGQPADPQNREPLNRCGGLWARETKRGKMPVGNLSNPKPRDGRPVEFQLPKALLGARTALRKSVGTEPGAFQLEITPQTVAESRLSRYFGEPKPPTSEEIVAAIDDDTAIPF